MNFLFKVHTYLFYTIVACMFTSVFEMIYINDVRPALARAAFTLLQGTWFYQVCNHPWPLRVFGFRFMSACNSYIICGHSMTTWARRVARAHSLCKQCLHNLHFRKKDPLTKPFKLARADIHCHFMKTRSLCRTVFSMNGL